MEYFGVEMSTSRQIMLISFRSYDGFLILSPFYSIPDYPRPVKGIPVAITVINGTLTSSGKLAI